MKISALFFYLVMLLSAALFVQPVFSAGGGDIAVVVSPGTPVDDLSLSEVRKVLMGDRQYWSPNHRVTLLIRAPVAHERDVVLRTIYEMTDAQFRQYWIAKVFRAEDSAGPKIVFSNSMAVDLVGSIPGCVAFVDATQVPKGLKVLKINGTLPGDPKYPLR